MLDIDPNGAAFRIKVDDHPIDDLLGVGPWPGVEIDVKRIGFWVVVKFHPSCSLGVGARDRIAFVLDDDGDVTMQAATLTVRDLRGIVPALPGRITSDFRDQIEEAMGDEATRIVDEMHNVILERRPGGVR